MPDSSLVSLTINGRSLEAEKGRLVIDVAEEAGIFVPRFCYHPGMKSVAVCRMCLVRVEGQPKLLPACATPVDEGMTVSTVDDEAVDAQEGMLEFLLINHPLDCPICDRAGECPLQDQTYQHGPGSSRYVEPKRTWEKALEISELVVLDRERCVLCWRCVRFADEIAGDRFIQLVDRGAGTQILTFADDPFDSYFSGNTIQICPVGALTSKPYRFVSRPWNLQTAPSVCGYCSVGCPLTNESRAGRLVRCQALPNEEVNDFWICDKGRFGYHYVSSPDRLDTPLVRNDDSFERTGWGSAIDLVASKLKDARVGMIVGGHLTTEDSYAWGRLAREVLGTAHVDSRVQDEGAPYAQVASALGVAGSTATISDLDRASTIVWVGPDPKETLPVLYLRLRAAVRERGARLIVVGPRSLSLDELATEVLRRTLEETPAALRAMTDLGDAPVVCWGPAWPGRDESPIVDAALAVVRGSNGRFLMCPPHAGSQGAIDMGLIPGLDAGHRDAPDGMGTGAMLDAAASGELDALVLVGADLLADFPDRARVERALASKVFVVAVELFATETTSYADVVLPAAAYAERDGTFTNLERRIQRLDALLPPPGSATEPWRIAARLATALGSPFEWSNIGDVWREISKSVPTHADVDWAALAQPSPFDAPGPQYETPFGADPTHGHGLVAGPGGTYPKGFRQGAPFHTGNAWPLSWELRAFEARQRPGHVPPPPSPPEWSADGSDPAVVEEGFSLLAGRLIYDDGTMVAHSSALHGLARTPFAELNPADADALGVAAGDEVEVVAGDRVVRLPVRLGDIVARSIFIPFDQPGLRANTLMTTPNPVVQVRRP